MYLLIRRLPLIALLLVALGPSLVRHGGEARADTVFSNFGGGNTYDSDVWLVRGVGGGSSIDVAARFTVGSSDYLLTSADLALGLQAGTNLLNIYVIKTLTSPLGPVDPGASSTVSGMVSSASGGSVRSAAFDGSFVLSANTNYWLVVSAGASDTQATWFDNFASGFFVARQSSGAWQTFNMQVAPAFRINGAPIVPVPAPQAAMGGMALLDALAVYRLVRSRRAAR